MLLYSYPAKLEFLMSEKAIMCVEFEVRLGGARFSLPLSSIIARRLYQLTQLDFKPLLFGSYVISLVYLANGEA